jgi:transposase
VGLLDAYNINIDKTGHNHIGKKHWMLAVTSPQEAYFSINPSRSKKVLKNLIGDFKNIITSDRYAPYNYFDSQRQICWAHLKRDFTKIAQKWDKPIARIGENLLICTKELFELYLFVRKLENY